MLDFLILYDLLNQQKHVVDGGFLLGFDGFFVVAQFFKQCGRTRGDVFARFDVEAHLGGFFLFCQGAASR